jgi:dethiobiotin synthetase
MERVLFIAGTDTSAGKTVFASALLACMVEAKKDVFPLKPFCSGGRGDAEAFHAITQGRFPLDEINPWFFPEPIAPAIAARLAGRPIQLRDAIAKIEQAATKASWVLVEGAGGLLSPLGEGFNALDLITAAQAGVIIVAPNKLGTINHSLLTLRELKRSRLKNIQLVLVDPLHPDLSTKTNRAMLQELVEDINILQFPWLPPDSVAALQSGRGFPADETLKLKLLALVEEP